MTRLRHHYEVERELAAKLRASNRNGRTELFKTLYSELFERVPDHPRLTRRVTPEESQKKVAGQLKLLRPFLDNKKTLLEFAPGDCRLAFAASEFSEKVIGVDISDQSGEVESRPSNFELTVYDGYDLDHLSDGVADVAFSYQFLEHLHPDDVPLHFQQVARLLKPGGKYIFDTPHRFSGPHDVSRHFGETLDCFHFQEWTHRDLIIQGKKVGFRSNQIYIAGKAYKGALINGMFLTLEKMIGMSPRKIRLPMCRRVFQSVTMILEK